MMPNKFKTVYYLPRCVLHITLAASNDMKGVLKIMGAAPPWGNLSSKPLISQSGVQNIYLIRKI